MGKKVKKGKQRKDVFYHRAKEAGYRARASFKLIQLNKKYNFLQSARVCIDLCAAPGSWMQVCSKLMPVSSVIIGVDRYAIASIPNTLSIQGDITTEKLRQDLKTSLKTWKADLVLHDGAPNVGQNWLYDAYQQNLLVLHSFKLACEFLQKGGNFVTKVFRSKDHLSLQYVFRKLFKKVEATKPVASRFESAEIFVVCMGFLAPDKIDPEFFDPQHVFQSLEKEPRNTINVLKPEKTKKKAEGYEEGITMLFKKKKISEFLNSPNYIDVLEETNEFEWDSASARDSEHTTDEIREIVKDIKLLGRKDLRALINWRKAIKAELEELEEEKKVEKKEEEEEDQKKKEEGEDNDEIEQDFEELKLIQEQITQLKSDKDREDKQHRKRVEKKRKRLEDKMKLRLMVPGDPGPQETGTDGLFALETLDRAETIDTVVDQNADVLYGSDDDAEGDDDSDSEKRPKYEYYAKGESYLDSTGKFHKTAGDSSTEDDDSEYATSEDEGLDLAKEEQREEKKERIKKKTVRFANDDDEGAHGGGDEEADDDEGKTNPLLTDLVGDDLQEKRERKAEMWFSKDVFGDLETDEVEDYELQKAIKSYKKAGVVVHQKERRADKHKEEEEEGAKKGAALKKRGKAADKGKKGKVSEEKEEDEFTAKDAPDSGSDSDSDSGSDGEEKSDSGLDSDSEDEKESSKGPGKKVRNLKRKAELDSYGLALATKMIKSKKAMRDLYDEGWNKYMLGDEDLPDWFAKDEKEHNSKRAAVDKADVAMYEDRNKAVDARSIKKVVEARSRKKRRVKRRMQGAKKKAEVISNNADMSAREKATEMKKIYRKAANSLKPKGKTYVVMKKSFGGRKPKGVKGPSRMVDHRMKKDKRAAKKVEDRGKRKVVNRKPKGKKAKEMATE